MLAKKNINCLIVDDEAIAREIIATHLSKIDNVNVIASCNNALEAFNVINNHTIDLVFLDINMPEMDGFDFLDEYALFPEAIRSHCTVFILTSSGNQKDIDRAAQYPCVKKFIKKPLDKNIIKEL